MLSSVQKRNKRGSALRKQVIALLRWSNWWLMKTAFTWFMFEMLSVLNHRVSILLNVSVSSLKTFGWAGEFTVTWLTVVEDVDCHHPFLAHHQRLCPSKRKDQHVQATTLVGLEMHVDMHVALLLLSYSTDVMCQKKERQKKGKTNNGMVVVRNFDDWTFQSEHYFIFGGWVSAYDTWKRLKKPCQRRKRRAAV